METCHCSPSFLAPSGTLRILWCGWTRCDSPDACVLQFINTPSLSGRLSLADFLQSRGGHSHIASHSPWWPSFPGEEQVSFPFYTDGKTKLKKRHVVGPRSSIDLESSILFTMWCYPCRSQLLCLGGEFGFTKLSKLLASWRYSRQLK